MRWISINSYTLLYLHLFYTVEIDKMKKKAKLKSHSWQRFKYAEHSATGVCKCIYCIMYITYS